MSRKEKTVVVRAWPRAQFVAAVRRAAAALRAGRLVAIPTETVYGLAANALDGRAVAGIFRAKGRPASNPIIVHVASHRMARQCVAAWPNEARKLAAAFWPGPLTLVLPRSSLIPDAVTARGETVGVRWPAHPLARAVIRACGFPLAAPSANRSTRISPTSARHVLASLDGRIPLIVDGGDTEVGIESTVLDLTVRPARILRPGMIHEEAIEAVLGPGSVVCGPATARGRARSPGLLRKHYAPRARLRLLTWRDGPHLLRQLRGLGAAPQDCHLLAHRRLVTLAGLRSLTCLPHDPAAFARAIYAELHRADEQGARWIIVETPPDTISWRGITDRLRRASAD